MKIDTNKKIDILKIEKVKDSKGEEYTIQIICYDEPIAKSNTYGDVYSLAKIESPIGEIVFSLLFGQLTGEQIEKQFDYMKDNLDKILEERRNA